MLHPSLTDLSESAPLCADFATVRGVIAESHDMLSNALHHGESPAELAGWFSQLISDALHSPGVDATLVLTGPVGRGDALPTSPVRWLAVVDTPSDKDPAEPVTAMLRQLGFTVEPIGFASREEWERRARSGKDAAVFLDAGTWAAKTANVDTEALLHDALASRPPTLHVLDGLPSLDHAVSIRENLLIPTVKIARWAAYSAGSLAPTTAERLAQAGDFLSSDEVDYLTQVWKAGLELQSKRWMDHIHDQNATAWDMPALQRTTFGAAARMLSNVMHSVAQRNGIAL